ncbi:hypothetical protein [Cryptosporangium phraense]|nr:hypothetical protein [Cryptosporangium phraense]
MAVTATGLAVNLLTNALPKSWGWLSDWRIFAGIAAISVIVTFAIQWVKGRNAAVSEDPDQIEESTVGGSAAADQSARATGTGSIAIAGHANNSILATGSDARIDARKSIVVEGNLSVPANMPVTKGIRNLPRPPSYRFVGRTDTLSQLHELLQRGPGGVLGQAVQGLGGVGKTEVALQYIKQWGPQYAGAWWLNAETFESIETELAGLAGSIDPTAAAALDTPKAADWALDWLSTHEGWLVVLDNVSELEHISRIVATTLNGGSILVTSRRQIPWSSLGLGSISISSLRRDASISLLSRVMGEGSEDADAALLASDLGDLPLALEQAGAYLAQSRSVSIANYRERLKGQPLAVLSEVAEGTPADRAVAATLKITTDAIAEKYPFALEILAILSYFAPQGIPTEIVTIGPEDQRTSGHELSARFEFLRRTA